MEVRAVSKNTGIPPFKARLLVDMVRGKSVTEALTLLNFTPSPAARIVAKVIKSAAANAENVFQMSPEELKVVRIFADEARTMKRFRARSRGRVSPILKRSSHITVIVAGQES
jgi:large subunit ribosomal protein L22